MTGPLWGALPDGWLAGQVKNAATVTLGKMLQSQDSGSDVRAPYMRAANVQPDGVLALDDVNEMWFGHAELEQLSIRAGDVVVVEGGQGGFGRAAYVDEDLPGWGFQNSINRLRPIGDFDGRFIAFYLIALRASGFIRAYSNVVSMPHLTAEKLARIPMPLPHLEEQRAIADYLDRETARIDTLIEEQQRLIDMLCERRNAVIRHTSEVVGVPVVRLGWFARVSSGDGININEVSRTDDSAGSVPVIGGNGLMGFGARSNVSGSVVVIGRVGALCGNVHRVDEPAWITDNALRLDDLRDFDVDFLRWHLEGRNLNALSRSTAQPLITGSQVAALRVPMPSLEEQRRLAVYLDNETEKIDSLISEAERFIQLARERRAALITAAVTGQIDVLGG